VSEKCGPHITPYTFSKTLSRQQKKYRNALFMDIFGTPFQAKTKGAFDSVLNQKKGVNTIPHKK